MDILFEIESNEILKETEISFKENKISYDGILKELNFFFSFRIQLIKSV